MITANQTTRISFVGDLLFGDQPVTFGFGFGSIHSRSHYDGIFDGVTDRLSESTLVVGNFESIILPRPSKRTLSN